MYYEHKKTGQIVKILVVNDRQDLASAVITTDTPPLCGASF